MPEQCVSRKLDFECFSYQGLNGNEKKVFWKLEEGRSLLGSIRNFATLSHSVMWKVGNMSNELNDLAKKMAKQSQSVVGAAYFFL